MPGRARTTVPAFLVSLLCAVGLLVGAAGPASADIDPATVESTTSLTVGGAAQTIPITVAGKSVVVAFTATGTSVDAGLTASTLAGKSVSLWNAAGTKLLTQTSSGTAAALHLTGLTTGAAYRLLIDPSGASTVGQVTVTLSAPVTGTLWWSSGGTTAALSRAGQTAVLGVAVGTASTPLNLGLTANTITATSRVSVLAPNGAVVVSNALLSASSSEDVEVLLPVQTGTYTVVVTPDNAATGSVTVTASTPVTGALSATGAGTAVSLARPGQDASLTFSGTAGTGASVGFSANTVAKPSFASVIAPDGTVVVNRKQIPASTAGDIDIASLPQTGTYKVTVDPNDAATGSFTTTLSAPDTTTLSWGPASTPITLARPGQDASLPFAVGTPNTAVSIAILANTVADYTYVDVIAPDGTMVYENHQIPPSTAKDIDLVLPAQTGTYKFVIDPDEATTGTMSVALSVPVTGTLSATGAGTTSTITRPGQDLALTFTGTAGSAVSVGFTGSTIPTYAYARIVKPDGTDLTAHRQVTSSLDVDIDVPSLPVTGTYKVVIDADDSVSYGSVTATLSDRVAPVALTIGGAALPSTITRAGQDAAFTFSGTLGQQLKFTASNLGSLGTSNPLVYVYRPDGVQFHYIAGIGNGTYNLPDLTLTGTYTIVIDPGRCGTGTPSISVSPRP